MGERHVFCAGLDGQEEIAECGERGGGEHEEDHDGAVHGHQLQVILRRHQSIREAKKWFSVRPVGSNRHNTILIIILTYPHSKSLCQLCLTRTRKSCKNYKWFGKKGRNKTNY